MKTSKLHVGGSSTAPQQNAANGGQSETANQNQLNGPVEVAVHENPQYGTPYAKVPFAAKPLGPLHGPFKLAPQAYENTASASTPSGLESAQPATAPFASPAFPYGPFADLMMDSAFKRAFGDDNGAHGNKQRLLLLLQLILPEKNIVDISYCNTEHISPYLDSKNIRIDVECVTPKGDRFIVEMQKLNQRYFSERMVYYSAAAVLSQIPAGQDSYKFTPVYMIAILNFKLNENHDKVKYEYFIKSDENELMTKNLQFTFIELPNHRDINSPEATRLDKFCWLLRNMSKFKERPDTDGDPLFDLLVESADFTIFTPNDKNNYRDEMTTERDRRNQFQYELEQEVAKAKEESFAEGHENGLAEGERIGEARGIEEGEKIGEARGIEETKLATAKKMLALGLGLDVIAQVTGFSVETLKDME